MDRENTVQAVELQTLSRDYKTDMSILALLPDLHGTFPRRCFISHFPLQLQLSQGIKQLSQAPTTVLSRTSSISFKGVSRKLFHLPVAISSSLAVPYRQFVTTIFNSSSICASNRYISATLLASSDDPQRTL